MVKRTSWEIICIITHQLVPLKASSDQSWQISLLDSHQHLLRRQILINFLFWVLIKIIFFRFYINWTRLVGTCIIPVISLIVLNLKIFRGIRWTMSTMSTLSTIVISLIVLNLKIFRGIRCCLKVRSFQLHKASLAPQTLVSGWVTDKIPLSDFHSVSF